MKQNGNTNVYKQKNRLDCECFYTVSSFISSLFIHYCIAYSISIYSIVSILDRVIVFAGFRLDVSVAKRLKRTP